MPTLDTSLLLDMLFAVIVLLFVPFGIRRGVAKEAMVSAGILIGIALAAAWTETGADRVGEQTDFGSDMARFVVAAGAVVLSTIILGYGGGAALGRVRAGILSRLAGGLLAAFNGAVLLSALLRLIERYLWRDEGAGVADDGYLGRYLLRDDEWLLLAAAVTMGVCVIFGWIVTGFRTRNEPLGEAPSQSMVPMPPRQRPVRVARDADAGKYEPVATQGTPLQSAPPPRPGRFGGGVSSLGQTAPITGQPDAWRSPETPNRGESWPRPKAMLDESAKTNGHASAPTVAGDWLRRATGRRRGGEADDAGGHGREHASNRRLTGLRCPGCGAAVGEQDVFCPECGATV